MSNTTGFRRIPEWAWQDRSREFKPRNAPFDFSLVAAFPGAEGPGWPDMSLYQARDDISGYNMPAQPNFGPQAFQPAPRPRMPELSEPFGWQLPIGHGRDLNRGRTAHHGHHQRGRTPPRGHYVGPSNYCLLCNAFSPTPGGKGHLRFRRPAPLPFVPTYLWTRPFTWNRPGFGAASYEYGQAAPAYGQAPRRFPMAQIHWGPGSYEPYNWGFPSRISLYPGDLGC